MSKKTAKISLRSLSITPQKTRKKRQKENPITVETISYLDLHAGNLKKTKTSNELIDKVNNKSNNDFREILVVYIFRMKPNDPFLTDEVHGDRWMFWYKQSLKIKKELQDMYKDETGETEDGHFHIKLKAGQSYTYDFSVRITNKNKTKRTFIPLEYKHQNSLDELPQFFQTNAASTTFFPKPYHEYHYKEVLPQINQQLKTGIILKESEIEEVYETSLRYLEYKKGYDFRV